MSLCACLCVHELTEGWNSSVKCVMLGREEVEFHPGIQYIKVNFPPLIELHVCY